MWYWKATGIMDRWLCFRDRRWHSVAPVAGLLLGLTILALTSSTADAYDPLDPNGNITIKWDIMSWTPDGYVAMVTMFNFQQYRHIQSPGWTLGWAKKEVIWSMVGAQATEQGDCSRFKGNVPHCCKKNPTVVDLLPGVPYNQQVANCCKGGVISSYAQDPVNAIASFQISAGSAGTSNKTVRLPKNFTLQAPGPGYTCGPAKHVKSSQFPTADGRRFTQALMTWGTPACIDKDSPYLKTPGLNTPTKDNAPLIQCTNHMCPIRIHWHVKVNYKEYWRVKISVTNFNYRMNYTHWNIVAQHPNFNNLTQLFSFNYKPLTPYGIINDTALFWGVKFYNDMLMQAGPMGNVQSELLLQKEKETFTFKQGWAFPRRVYFNGDDCVLPPPDAYPTLPNGSPALKIAKTFGLIASILSTAYLFFFL